MVYEASLEEGAQKKEPCNALPHSDLWEEAARTGPDTVPSSALGESSQGRDGGKLVMSPVPFLKFSPLCFLFLRLSISLVALEKDENEHQGAVELFAFLLPPLHFLGCAISPPPSPLPSVLAGHSSQQDLPLSWGLWGHWMQCSSIYHSALGRLKKRKKDKPPLHVIKEKFTQV